MQNCEYKLLATILQSVMDFYFRIIQILLYMKLTNLSFVFVFKYRNLASIQRLIPVRFFVLIAAFCLFTYCSEILSVHNISHERIDILSPSDGG